ncbi:nitroreductase [Mycena filopes]|nr:nitroreductase [Mycena filopes]
MQDAPAPVFLPALSGDLHISFGTPQFGRTSQGLPTKLPVVEPPNGATDPNATSQLTALVNRLLKERYSARYFLPTQIDKAAIVVFIDAANHAPSGRNMQPWKVYCISGTVKDTLSAAMMDAFRSGNAAYAPRYTYYPPVPPAVDVLRHFEFGKTFYGALGIAHDDVARRALEVSRNYEFFDAPVALIFTISSELRQGSWMDLGHFMQSVTIGVRARGLESVTQLSVAKYDEIIRKHLPIPENDVVACSMSVGYPDLEKVAKNYARPAKRALGDVLEIHGM